MKSLLCDGERYYTRAQTNKNISIHFPAPVSVHGRSGDASFISVSIKFIALKHPNQAEM
jgi:hypothetical protein